MRKGLAEQMMLMAMLAGYGALPSVPRNRVNIHDLVDEYNLIVKKQSRLSRAERDGIQHRVQRMLSKGDLVESPDGTVSLEIRVNQTLR